MKVCHACGKEKPLDQFNWKDKAKQRRSPTCRECMRQYIQTHYRNNVDYYIKKARRRKKAYIEATYKKITEYLLAHPCVDCGEADPIVLEFDHIEKETKTAEVSKMFQLQRRWDIIMKEIEKCEVRCANCHRRRTAKQQGWHRYINAV